MYVSYYHNYGLELGSGNDIIIVLLFTEPDGYVTITTNMTSTTNCIEIEILDDDLVGGNKIIRLHLTTNDSVIMLVQPTIAEIVIVNTDGTAPI